MKTILFVDDEPWFHEAIRATLESKGMTCLVAVTMTGGLEILRREEVDVVVTDIMMSAGKEFPKVDSQETGFVFVKHIKVQWPKIPVVCLSVIGDDAKIRYLRNLGAEYLRKGEVPLSTVVQSIQRAALEGGEKTWRF
jgi:DNA-binding NarL/FixJ family response regulator